MARGDGGVYQPGDRPSWWCYVPAKPKRAVRGPFKTEAEARRAWKDLRREIAAGRYRGPEEERLTVEDLVKAYRTWLEMKGRKSMDSFDAHARILIAKLGHLKAVEVTADTINRTRQEWLKERRKTKKKGELGALRRGASTTDRYLEVLRAAYWRAVKDKRISPERVPCIELVKPDNRRKGFIEEDLFWGLYRSPPDVERDVCLFAYRSGWRRGEVEGLTWEQIDLREREARLNDSKNGQRRVLPLEEELWQVIQRRQPARTYETQAGPALSPLVFHRGGFALGDWRKTWTRACDAFGVPGLKFHDFRRSMARAMILAGVPAMIVMSVGGWPTRSMLDRYGIMTTKEEREAIRATVRRLRGSNSYGTATV